MSRTVGGYPFIAEYRLMKSKISCWRFVKSILCSLLTRDAEHVFGNIAAPWTDSQMDRTDQRPGLYWPPPAPVAELVDAQG